jgi:protease-4
MKMTWGQRRAIIIIVLAVFLVILCIVAMKPGRTLRLPSNAVLVIDAAGQIEEQRAPDIFSAFNGYTIPVLHDYVDAIDAAAKDSHISGLVVRIAPLETGWGKLEEIRSHLLAFRKSGKPSICYLGYDGIGNPEYYLASACQQIWLVPTAPVSIRGMMAEAVFFRGTLDKLKVVPEFYHIAEFKTAGNTFTEKQFTPAHKEEVEGLLRSIYDQYLNDASKGRGMDRAQFEALVTRGPFSSSDAVANKIVDRLGYWDQLQDYFKNRAHGWNPLSLNRYRASLSNNGTTRIAVVHATGLIVSGDSGNTPGGGSVVGSEVIRREVELANQVKPVVVSMSDVAASGGYWIAAPARKIVADRDTITGSIGVLIGKFNVSGLYTLLGISTDYVATSENATLFSAQQNFSPAQRAYIQKSLNDTYSDFTKGVALGRKMTVEAVDKIGKGRVWSGAQAKELGLVDELGGLDRAIEVAKQLSSIPASESVHIVRYPEEKSFFEQFLERQKDNNMSESQSLESMLQHIVSRMEPVQARMPYELHIR